MKAVMKEANLYQTSNTLQKRDAAEILKEFSSRMHWKPNKMESILDIGCGDGSVTVDLLEPYIPKNYRILTGCDIAPEMIRHATLHHKDERTEFKILDIASEVPEDMVEEYDHVFSFYTLHWVQQQQKALSNIYDLLAVDGECLLVFLGHIPIYDVYRILAATDKWAEYMYDLEKYISPYHDSEEPELEFSQLMEDAGFRDVDVQCQEKQYIYDNLDMVRKAVRAVNPFNQRLSLELREQFLDDYVAVLHDMDLVQESNNNEGEDSVRCSYTLLVAYGVK